MSDPTLREDGGPASTGRAVFDRDVALHHVGGDPELLRELVEMFLDQAVARMNAVEEALGAGDWTLLGQLTHALKGTAAMLGMSRLRDTAYSVEGLGSEGRPSEAAVREMRAAMDEVVETLRSEMAS